jgi:hypothetical protein
LIFVSALPGGRSDRVNDIAGSSAGGGCGLVEREGIFGVGQRGECSEAIEGALFKEETFYGGRWSWRSEENVDAIRGGTIVALA